MQLKTIEWGDGPRSALLLHGITSNAAGWWRLGPAIADAGYSVVAADMRGHGESPKSGDHRLASHVGDVLELGRGFDVVLGHSMGGLISMLATVEDTSWAKQLILEDPAIYVPDIAALAAALVPEFGATEERLIEENPEWHRRDAAIKARALEQCGPEVVDLMLVGNSPIDYRNAALRLSTPTTIIGAHPDHALVPPQLGEQLAANPAIVYAQVAGSHSMHRDRWDEFWGVVSRLL